MDGRNRNNPAPGEVQSQRPVENVLWYEAILFCNRLSVASGREPAYHIWGVPEWEDYLKWAIYTSSSTAISNVYVDGKANGYRLPTADEWTWAAMGADIQSPGQVNATGAKKYYSGGLMESNTGIENFTWCFFNSSGITHEVGKKLSNELGLFDMTGNVNEWVWGGVFSGKQWTYQGNFALYLVGGVRHYERQVGDSVL
ncbi:MAG: formylglycine-generating enzyme family protein [Treponema sp.]|nr:formylglycine-generating enzyme family protein [Treponema sp.]